jgi:excisionase family DNA binding protein
MDEAPPLKNSKSSEYSPRRSAIAGGEWPIAEAPIEPLALTIPEACALARIGRTSLYEAIRSGQLRAVKQGQRTLILFPDLRAYVESLPRIEPRS